MLIITSANIYLCLLYAGYSAKPFICIFSFNLINHLLDQHYCQPHFTYEGTEAKEVYVPSQICKLLSDRATRGGKNCAPVVFWFSKSKWLRGSRVILSSIHSSFSLTSFLNWILHFIFSSQYSTIHKHHSGARAPGFEFSLCSLSVWPLAST